jgi:xylulokinase
MDLRASMNGTYGLDWCRGNIAADPDPAEMDRAASASRAGSGGVIFEPYLSAAGERSPFCNSAAKGGFFGISALTRREDLIRAVYEGITFSIKDCLGKADSSAGIFLAGGGTRSKVWPQMIADVLGCRVTVPGGRELGAKGAMMMAAAATGGFPDIRAAAEKCCETAAEYLPGSDGAVYDRCYELFVGLRRAAGPLWERRAALMGPENAKQIV